MKTKSWMLLLIAAAFLSLIACKKDVDSPGTVSGNTIDPQLLGKWGWYNTYTRAFDDAGNVEYETDPFEYGNDDVQDDYKDNGTYTRTTDNGYVLPGTWAIKNGKLVLDGSTEYEYSFENNNRTLILKHVIYSDN